MSTRRETLEANRAAIMGLVREHRGLSVEVFGSVARGDDSDGSDIDLLVEFTDDSSLFDLLHLQDSLEALLGCSVDVVSVGALTDRDGHIRAESRAV